MSESNPVRFYRGRYAVVLGTLCLVTAGLVWRAVDLQVVDRQFLQDQGDARHLRVVSVPAHRGMITDRHGEPLAMSTPVQSVWVNPAKLMTARDRWPELARALEMAPERLAQQVESRRSREFVYLRRHMNPSDAQEVLVLGIPGVSIQKEYRRYYPTGEVSAHVVGFTNIDDEGQEGLELQFERYLRGHNGSKRVIRDRLGQTIANVESIEEPRPGRDIALSLDRRIQYLAYRELKAAVSRHKAKAGSAVVLDARTGEVLAMVNQPAYNPNNRNDLVSWRYRNRAVTDVFEPGSTVKPFTVSAALETGRYEPETSVDTSPGYYQLAGFTVSDHQNYGEIDVATVIKKSSNVGASRIALDLQPRQLWQTFSRVGLGIDSGSGFPGEATGTLSGWNEWRNVTRATVSYGYGLSVTPLQLANAYSVIAGDGRLRPVSFLSLDAGDAPAGRVALSPKTVRQVRGMLEAVVSPGGTGEAARVPGYRVAGKTGTVHKAIVGGYSEDRYSAVFAGMAPVSRPRLVMMVMIDEPSAGEYFGGQVAAPVFARVMEGALRLLDIPPDDIDSLGVTVAEASQ
ncbi:peptidoglycan D,D-transpeptidase FtsI family protein [Thiohalomonas denitrificans]|uniref:peptidoglycan D,D-transpeptidase FtsI family protein n=1 Tax=Thiohalomonas denitrificans TaxID=415747 RepID=UPI0026EB8803|nr:penicillin-binding transpeptidase domain-containing protein [Thiohalomonas denitrificans]